MRLKKTFLNFRDDEAKSGLQLLRMVRILSLKNGILTLPGEK